ncbi:MAG: zinc-dependent metalloprotease, partial [Gemmatimonadales bacterium]
AKKDPRARVSEAVEPIVYYLDRGAPEPIRSALLDGARWWNQAFEAAGYRNAFRVELMPEGADPLDVRYNVIQWVHRFTRGWSYGSTVTDPRTGEIIKGHVSLGSLRVRQDFLIAQGLLAPFVEGNESTAPLEAMALARIRQLSAHEVGHTLGIQHNYISSAEERASVMDYPHPLVRLMSDGTLDLSDAYAVGIGEWDKEAVKFGYQDFPPGTDERAALDGLIRAARARGLTFLTDQDARPTGSAHPRTHLWDNGTDAGLELDRVMAVRRTALARFGDRALPAGRPLATLEEVLVPLYLHHRYQVEAAVKAVGGQFYDYAFRGDGVTPLEWASADLQERALGALLRTLNPKELALPPGALQRIPPRPVTFSRHRELFPRTTGLVFDAVSPATVAADLTVGLLLDEQRASRLVIQHDLDQSLPSLDSVIDRLFAATFEARDGLALRGRAGSGRRSGWWWTG